MSEGTQKYIYIKGVNGNGNHFFCTRVAQERRIPFEITARPACCPAGGRLDGGHWINAAKRLIMGFELYSLTIRFSFPRSACCPIMRHVLCGNWKIVSVCQYNYIGSCNYSFSYFYLFMREKHIYLGGRRPP